MRIAGAEARPQFTNPGYGTAVGSPYQSTGKDTADREDKCVCGIAITLKLAVVTICKRSISLITKSKLLLYK
jgi:hypothetical protein